MNFNEYQIQADKFVLPTAYRLEYLVAGLAGEAGEVASAYAKYVRDDTPRNTLRKDLVKELGDTLWFISEIAQFMDIDLSVIAEQNILKLTDRKQRNVIGGSGNVR
jgi:NTP pyrophosphatase (non-canonical NTP hydrolase)